MAQNANKLVGTQYLDLSRLKNDVAETNKLLQSIGAGVNLNMTDVVEKQVKSVLTRFKNEVQSMASQTAQAGQQASSGLRPVNTQMQALLSTTQRLAKDGSLTETRKGFDALGNTITEVYQAGQLLNRTVSADSALSKDLKYANELYQQQIAALRTIYSLRAQRQTVRDDTQTAQQLDAQIADSQKLVEDNRQMIALLDQQAVSRSKLVNLAEEETALRQKYAAAQAAQQDKLAAKEFSGANELRQAKELYAQLTQAQRNYIAALKNKDAVSQNYWTQSIQQASGELRALEQKLGSLNIEEGTRRKILALIQQAKDAEKSHVRNVDNLNATAANLDETLDRIGTRLLRMAATMVVLRGQTAIWRGAIDYAQKYYDKLNEIQIVTGKSDAAIQRMGQNYRKLAAQMSVTSTEIAEAAVEFWRQGLDETEVNSRLKATTQYAKISSMAFEKSAELVTAATNTMEIGAQRVVDVFAYLGDASASGADEIGVAMQKASASAKEFGMSFEWLGAYIATISEKTRQAPEVIGTSLNSIMARLHSIKAKGFNEEDATKINDIAKALGTLETPIKLIDEETGKWRDMPVIFEEIARQWNTLDAKQRAYISTTIAGTRQQNYFLALMSDMAKGAEGGSRAFELYEGAMTAAGTAAGKYAVWQESVTAAQNRLTAATQDFYALLNTEWMKSFYDGMADIVNILTAGTDAMNGWNIIVPVATAGIAALIAVTYKAVTAFKALQVAMAAGQGAATLMSGGTIAAISAALGVIALLVTSVVGASSAAAKAEKIDYSGTAASVASYRDNISSLIGELEAQAAKTELTAEEQARAEDIMRILSGTSLSMKAALEGGGEGFDTLGQKAAAARSEVERTEQVLRSLNAADALQNLRDADHAYATAISDAQKQMAVSSQYGSIASAYGQFMQEHPEGKYLQGYSGPMGSYASKEENFFTYAKNKAEQPKPIWYSAKDKAAIQADRDFWAVVVQEMEKLGIDYSSSVEEISNKMLEFDIAAATYANANRESLASAWQPVLDDLYTVMTDGSEFAQLPSFMQDAARQYYETYTSGIDQQAELAEGDLMAMAANLTGYVKGMNDYLAANADFSDLISRFDKLSQGPYTQETVDELNALLPVINEFITAYNAITESTDDDIALIPEFSLENLREEAEAAQEALISLSTADIYKNLELAREEANGFASVLSKLGDGEGQLTNLHDAVMQTAQDQADAVGITDAKEIGKIGETLLKGLYDTYPEIADYVDTATGMLLDGWKEGLAHATNPWAEFFDKARMEDALREAQRDMAALDGSQLWEELLSPDGKGLYAYAEDWARSLIPDGTEEEIHAQAEAFVEAFFAMFEDIDTEIMDADGRIAAGMDGIIATMRRAVHDAQTEKTKLEDAYRSLHADTIARREAIEGLTAMAGLAQSGDAAGVNSTFEALSTEVISAIAAAMPGQIDKLHEGTAAADDFEAAILKLREAEDEVGREAWKGYFDKTAEGLKQQSVLWSNAMRGIIAEVSAAEDKEAAFYQALIRLSNEGVDVSGMLEQYGALGAQLLNGAKSADELYASLTRLENLNGLQVDLENVDALTQAAKAIDPAQSGYDPLSALASYDLLEARYAELMELQRGSAEYIQRARELTDEETAAVYRQAAAYGVVTDLQAKSAQAAAASQTERTFRHADENAYAGGASYLAQAAREAEVAGEDVAQAWNRALSNLDEAGVLEGMSALFGDISMLAVECGGNVEKIIRRLYEMRDAAQSISLSDMAEELRRERESNTGGTEGYRSQVDELFSAFGEGGMEGVSRAMEIWNGFDKSLQQSIAETYPSLVIALDDANQAAIALNEGIGELESAEGELSDSSRTTEKKIEALGKELDVAQKNASARSFKNTARAIEDLKHGTISAADAFGDYNAEADKAIEANEEYQKASKKMAAGTKVTADEIDTLAQFLGNIDPNILLANWDQVGPMISSALAEGEAAFDRLNEAAFVTITGTSVADFSALTAGLISVQNLAADAVDALIATGQWKLETITLPQEGAQWDPIAGVWTRTRINTNQNVLRYTGSNPLRSGGGRSASSGGGGGKKGGGGSGGSSSTSVSKSIEKTLDKMDATVDIEDHRRKMAQLGQNYHETRGEIQGVLKYMELEKQVIRENSATLEDYVSSLEAQIESKKAVLAATKESSSKYKQAMVDLEALQEQHKRYSQTLVQNKIDLEELEKAMKEQQDAIRQMEIDLRELIHDAILDREDLIKRMLNGQIDLENELIDALTRRYEKERDELLKLAETKRDALNEELALLDQQLEARRQLNEQQDRAKLLAEKEAQLARISADPTRKKEELALREEIAKLREEIAWELAEEEVDAQKKSIESQMESIDDYMEYVQTYYEELLSNPRKLIEEMQALLTQTDEEILLWLTQNHEDYQTATDATREQMRREWQEMLDDMRGNTQTYWDEVEEIIAQGDQAIIDFLMANSADYREAGKLQAQAYADEWQKQLDALKAAYRQVSAEIQSYNYTPTTKPSSSGSSKSSSSSSSSSKKTTTQRFVASGTGYAEAYIKTATSISYNGSTYVKDPHSNYWYKTSDARRIDGGRTYYWKTGTKRYVKKYAEGGVAEGTGLAWLDGTKQRPERILSPYQTELFEDMLKTLHAIRTFQAPASIVQPKLPDKPSQQGLHIDSITVQVQRLDSDQDYEEMAERVGEHIMERVSRGMTVGGIRIG